MKRSRAANFTEAEILLLLRVVEQFPIIENKRTDAATAKEKQLAWEKLSVMYNSQSSFSPRSADKLMRCYKNLKVKVKKIHSNAKMAVAGKKNNVSLVVHELAEEKKDLVNSQKTLLDLKIQHQKLQIDLMQEKIEHEKKKNQMELDFLSQKYEIELNMLRNSVNKLE